VDLDVGVTASSRMVTTKREIRLTPANAL
jgi:hypothetical protein